MDIATYTEPETRTVIDWTPESAKTTETSADAGNLINAADLCERILADDRVSGVMAQRTSIVRLPLDFVEGSPRAVERLQDGDFWRILPAAQLQQIHRWWAMFGVSVGRLQWADEAGKVLRSNGLHTPVVSAWSSARHVEREFFSRRWLCEVGDSGVRQEVTPGDNGWLLWTMASERPWSLAAWRSCRVWWLLKQYAIQDWARYSERHGQGTVTVKVPEGQAKTKAKRQALAKEVRQMGANGVLVLPDGYEAGLVEATARTHGTFQQQIEAANAGIAIALLGQNLTSEVKSGSLASARVHEVVAANIIATDAEALSDFVHDQILVPWAVANFGSADAAPWPIWDTTPPENAKPRIDGWVELGKAIAQFRTEGVPVDVEAMAEQAGVPLRKGESVKPPEPPENELKGTDDQSVGNESEADSVGDQASASGHSCHHPQARVSAPQAASQKRGERDGERYTDRVAESLQTALAADLAPHLQRMVEIVSGAGNPPDYDRVRRELEDYYREQMGPEAAAQAVRAGLTMAQLAGWSAVRVDAPELGD